MVVTHDAPQSSRLVWLACSMFFSCAVAVGCAQTDSDSADTADGQQATSGEQQTVEQAQDQSTSERWIAGADAGSVSLITAEGETPEVVGRVVNGGAGIRHAAVGDRGWLTGGANGQTQLIDEQGKPVSEPRTAIEGNQIRFIASRGSNWLVGGDGGRVQRVNVDGQPTSDKRVLFSGASVTAGASNGTSEWLVGAEDGQLATLSHSDLQPDLSSLADNSEIVDIVWAQSENAWFVFTLNGYAKFTAAGPSSVTDFGISSEVTTATATQSLVAVGRADGRVAVTDPGSIGSLSWNNVLQGSSIEAINHDGNQWVVVGADGRAVKVDDSGQVVGSMQTLGGGRMLNAVRPISSGWMVGVESISVVQEVAGDLTPATAGDDLLGGSTINAVLAGPEHTLIAGDGGKYRLLNPDGTTDGPVRMVNGMTSIETGQWNGRNYFVGGSGGQIARIEPDGTVKETVSVLGSKTIIDMSYTGQFWLVAASDGTVRRLRSSGTPYQQSTTVGLDTVRAVGYNGDYWLLVGTYQSLAGYVGFNSQGDVTVSATSIQESTGLHSVEWGGREWLVGGEDGIAFRIDQGGSVIRQGQASGPRDVLYNATIRAIDFDGSNYLLVGDFGLVRRLQFSTLPFSSGKIINGFDRINAIDWTNPRGFPGGKCISSDTCLQGFCIGSVSDGVCCDEQCEGPCISCFESQTGESDGTCAPIPQGEDPPQRKRNQGVDCITEAEETCGQTGVCDGSGNCALYGTDVMCRSKTCESTSQGAQIREAAFCDGEGNCPQGSTMSCEPYAACQQQSEACLNSCQSDSDCATGYVCEAPGGGGGMKQCVEPGDGNGDGNGGGGGGSGGGGGCQTASTSGLPLAASLVLFLVGGILRLRSTDGTGG